MTKCMKLKWLTSLQPPTFPNGWKCVIDSWRVNVLRIMISIFINFVFFLLLVYFWIHTQAMFFHHCVRQQVNPKYFVRFIYKIVAHLLLWLDTKEILWSLPINLRFPILPIKCCADSFCVFAIYVKPAVGLLIRKQKYRHVDKMMRKGKWA